MNFVKLVKPKNSLFSHVKLHQIKSNAINYIKEKIPEIEHMRLKSELTVWVCNIIETLCKHKSKINKKQLVVDILDSFFRFQPHEREIIEDQIQHSYDNGLIKKIPLVSKLYTTVKNFLFNTKKD